MDGTEDGGDARQKLLIALGARLERCEHEVAHAAVDWLEVTAATSAPEELREGFRIFALGECWRRERLRLLYWEVRNGVEDVRDRLVLFLALDACDPKQIPSFREWLDARHPPATIRG